jgi:hypothetical protein
VSPRKNVQCLSSSLALIAVHASCWIAKAPETQGKGKEQHRRNRSYLQPYPNPWS